MVSSWNKVIIIIILIGPPVNWQLYHSRQSGSSDGKSVMSGFDIYIMISPTVNWQL